MIEKAAGVNKAIIVNTMAIILAASIAIIVHAVIVFAKLKVYQF